MKMCVYIYIYILIHIMHMYISFSLSLSPHFSDKNPSLRSSLRKAGFPIATHVSTSQRLYTWNWMQHVWCASQEVLSGCTPSQPELLHARDTRIYPGVAIGPTFCTILHHARAWWSPQEASPSCTKSGNWSGCLIDASGARTPEVQIWRICGDTLLLWLRTRKKVEYYNINNIPLVYVYTYMWDHSWYVNRQS